MNEGREPLTVGALVNFRERDWVVVDRGEDHLRLRPLAGGEEQGLFVSLPLVETLQAVLPEEALKPSHFPNPTPEESDANYHQFRLFEKGGRLTLRDAVAPLRGLGRVRLHPRPYQLVPLLMALEAEPVRLLIADDVGVGKTIEAGLIARELWDRKEVRRMAVLAPPHLLAQWEVELREKFGLDPVVVTAGRLAVLERRLPPDKNIYQAYPVQLISIDFVKHDRHRPLFLQHAPELVIVDEAHGAVGGANATSHLRYTLVRKLAENPDRHMLLLTATPHSGVSEAFSRLLGLLDPEFASWDLTRLSDTQRARLAQHFVQRTRRDIEETWGAKNLFPTRMPRFEEYRLSGEYKKLYDEVHAYARGIVQSSEGLTETRRRMRWWAALSLLRSVMSSPASAREALERRQAKEELEDAPQEELMAVFDASTDEIPDDEIPSLPLTHSDQLRRLGRMAKAITPKKDGKLQEAVRIIKSLLEEEHYPVVWCHYVKTAEYLGEALRKELPSATIAVVTGRMDGELRREAVEELMEQPNRILVATDCVSEGVNLQKGFSAVLHYDLPWNPNRLEQREGRVDRYGQPKKEVVAVRYRGINNPVDQKVVEVLLKKADLIRKELGIYVPVPEEDLHVVEQMTRELFGAQRQALFDNSELFDAEQEDLWSVDRHRERITRTRFAQRALKPQQVLEAIEETENVLGGPEEVEDFVLLALAELGFSVSKEGGEYWTLRSAPARLPDALQAHLLDSDGEPKLGRFGFFDPVPAGVTFLDRNHPLVGALARHFLEGGLRRRFGRWAAWSGNVERATYVYLLRPRYRIRRSDAEVLGEEVVPIGIRDGRLLDSQEARALLAADPSGNVPRVAAQQLLELALGRFDEKEADVAEFLRQRAKAIEERHRKVLKAARKRTRGLAVVPILPADLLGVAVIRPKT